MSAYEKLFGDMTATIDRWDAEWELEISRYPEEWRDYFRAHRKWSATRRYDIAKDRIFSDEPEPQAPRGPPPRLRRGWFG